MELWKKKLSWSRSKVSTLNVSIDVKTLETFNRRRFVLVLEQRLAINEVVAKINQRIAPFDQTITKYEYGLTNSVFYVFHSTSGTSASKLNAYSEDDVEFFKLLLRNIIQDENLTITPLSALNLCTGGKMKKKQADKLLDSWCSSNYFKKHQGKIHLGPRVLVEFKELLQSLELNYLKSCLLCESIAIWVSQFE